MSVEENNDNVSTEDVATMEKNKKDRREKIFINRGCEMIKHYVVGGANELSLAERKTLMKEFQPIFDAYKILDETTIHKENLLLHCVNLIQMKDSGVMAEKSQSIKEFLLKRSAQKRCAMKDKMKELYLSKKFDFID